MIPVVLHHGLFGHGGHRIGPFKLDYFRKIDAAIAGAGHPVVVTQVHPSSSIQSRAAELKLSLLSRLGAAGYAGKRVILMAHSMGGLDARYAVAKLGLDRHVSAVVTVTTPHRGSPVADWVVRHLGRRLGGIELCRRLGLDFNGIGDLTTESCADFNDRTPDVPGVQYYSISAARPWTKIAPFALPAYRVVQLAEGDNDGLVSVKSSTWGNHLGVWPADHWHTINHRFLPELRGGTGNVAPLWLAALRRAVSENCVSAS